MHFELSNGKNGARKAGNTPYRHPHKSEFWATGFHILHCWPFGGVVPERNAIKNAIKMQKKKKNGKWRKHYKNGLAVGKSRMKEMRKYNIQSVQIQTYKK